MLEARGVRGSRVNARHLKHGPGRQTDVKDCQWRQSWHTWGLLSAACRPAAERGAVRAYGRPRATWLEERAAHLQPRPKALQQLNVQRPQGLAEITGATGLAIIRASGAGARDPVHVAGFRAPRWAHRRADLATALTGPDRAEQVVALQPALALEDVYTAQGRACAAEIARHFPAITPVGDADLPPLDRPDQGLSPRQHAPADDARRLLYQLSGVDRVAIPGLHASTGQPRRAELGLDLGKWPNAKACCAWVGLAPRPASSGGKVVRRRTRPTRHRAGPALRVAAQAAGRSPSGLGAFDRRMRARLGPQAAMVATAHKSARIIDHLRTHRTAFRERRPAEYRPQLRARALAAMRKKAARLGLTLVESQG